MKAYLSDNGLTVVVFFDDREDPEWYSTEEFLSIYGEEYLPCRHGDVVKILPVDYTEYWQAAIDMINAWSGYQGKRKLFLNRDANERIRDVIRKDYDGDLKRLRRQVKQKFMLVDEALSVYGYYCKIYRVKPVNLMWLRLHLCEDKNYKSLREKCRRRMDAGKQPVSLSELVC